jgi:hypothetical protein
MEEVDLCQIIQKPKSTQAKCKFENCFKSPNYNYQGEKKRLYCNSHKLEGMIDVKNKSCENIGCIKLPVFNYINSQKPRFCNSHKLTGMVNIKDKTCEFENCTTIPIFNYPDENFAIYCNKHKLTGMVDVKNKTCENINCYIQPNYNYKNETRARFCNLHKLENMVDVKNKSCENKDCITIAHFNYKGMKAKFCAVHKLKDMINITEKKCINSWCDNTLSRKKNFKDYCRFCYVNMFPDQPLCQNYKTKESSVAQFITTNFPNFTWNLDKKIEDGCSKRRPDIMCDLGYQVIIVEIDENQHTDYDCSCENKRIMQLSQDLGHRPIIFIRFNPDGYTKSNNEKITSCWGTDLKTGILKIKSNKKDEWNERLNSLKSQIEYWCNETNKTEKTIEIVQLFYDGFQ